MDKIQVFNQKYVKSNVPLLRSGDTVRVHERVKEKEGERIQVFEGVVIAVKHGKGLNATFTVRKISAGVGVEKTYPLHSPIIKKIEVVKHDKVRRAKLYYLRKVTKKRKKKPSKMLGLVYEETTPETEITNKKIAKNQTEDSSKKEVATKN